MDNVIPKPWTEKLLTELAPKNDWWAKFVGKYPAIEPPPWYKRRWFRIKWKAHTAREWVAVKIAPWLEPEDDW
jgi:hypothetical protein